MGLNLGGLIRAATPIAAGALRGMNDAEQRNYDRQRQAERDQRDAEYRALQMLVLKKQMEPPPAYTPESDPQVRREEYFKRMGLGTYRPQEPKPTGPIEVSPGATLVNPATGKPIYTAPKPVDPDSAKPKDPTEGERRASALLVGAESAFGEIKNMLDAGYTPLSEGFLSKAATSVGATGVGRAMMSDQGKMFRNAVKRLSTNYLYAVSGANATPKEIEAQAEQMVNDILDSPTTFDQKVRFMAGKVAELRQMAGNAAGQAPPVGIAAPRPRASTPADRWEELVAGGMDKAAATAQVQREFHQ